MRLAMVQPRTVRPEEQANVERAVGFVRRAAGQGAQFVAFPECYPGPYAGPVDWDAAGRLGEVARECGVYLAYGAMEPAGVDVYHNVYRVLGPDGTSLARYAKLIPAAVDGQLSGKMTVAGEEFVLLDTPWARVGLLICWEAWFPELCRTLAARGADVVLFPTGGMLYHLTAVWRTLIQARATENLIYTACCVNLFGVEDGMALVCAPEGPLASLLEEGILLADLDLERLHTLRKEDETLDFPKQFKTIPGLWRYNRPELYEL